LENEKPTTNVVGFFLRRKRDCNLLNQLTFESIEKSEIMIKHQLLQRLEVLLKI
jgi:hypothetical protein